MITVTNEEGLVIVFPTDELFLEYARAVYKEFEISEHFPPSEIHWLPENVREAKEYIHEYCNNLELTEE